VCAFETKRFDSWAVDDARSLAACLVSERSCSSEADTGGAADDGAERKPQPAQVRLPCGSSFPHSRQYIDYRELDS